MTRSRRGRRDASITVDIALRGRAERCVRRGDAGGVGGRWTFGLGGIRAHVHGSGVGDAFPSAIAPSRARRTGGRAPGLRPQ